MLNFSNEQIERYSRHIILKEVGGLGQTKLLESKVLLIGAGGLGSPAGLYLAAAGIGTLGIVDDDVVDISNLQRQVLHGTSDVGKLKTESAKETLADINPDVKVITYTKKIVSENAFDILEGYDVIVDGCDNLPTRYLLNDASVMLGKPIVHGSIFQFEGQVTCFPSRQRTVLSLPLSITPTTRYGAKLSRSRCDRCVAGDCWKCASRRSYQSST